MMKFYSAFYQHQSDVTDFSLPSCLLGFLFLCECTQTKFSKQSLAQFVPKSRALNCFLGIQ